MFVLFGVLSVAEDELSFILLASQGKSEESTLTLIYVRSPTKKLFINLDEVFVVLSRNAVGKLKFAPKSPVATGIIEIDVT